MLRHVGIDLRHLGIFESGILSLKKISSIVLHCFIPLNETIGHLFPIHHCEH